MLSALAITPPQAVDAFCAGSNDAPNIYRYDFCIHMGNTPGFEFIPTPGWVVPYAHSPPIHLDVGSRLEFYPNCSRTTLATVYIVVDLSVALDTVVGDRRGRLHFVRVCSRAYGKHSGYRNNHLSVRALRLPDGRFQVTRAGRIVKDSIPNPCG